MEPGPAVNPNNPSETASPPSPPADPHHNRSRNALANDTRKELWMLYQNAGLHFRGVTSDNILRRSREYHFTGHEALESGKNFWKLPAATKRDILACARSGKIKVELGPSPWGGDGEEQGSGHGKNKMELGGAGGGGLVDPGMLDRKTPPTIEGRKRPAPLVENDNKRVKHAEQTSAEAAASMRAAALQRAKATIHAAIRNLDEEISREVPRSSGNSVEDDATQMQMLDGQKDMVLDELEGILRKRTEVIARGSY